MARVSLSYSVPLTVVVDTDDVRVEECWIEFDRLSGPILSLADLVGDTTELQRAVQIAVKDQPWPAWRTRGA